jgi:hypothetical protein
MIIAVPVRRARRRKQNAGPERGARTMRVKVNGEAREILEGPTVAEREQ